MTQNEETDPLIEAEQNLNSLPKWAKDLIQQHAGNPL